jgi:fumarate reductase flavoprotein subunit
MAINGETTGGVVEQVHYSWRYTMKAYIVAIFFALVLLGVLAGCVSSGSGSPSLGSVSGTSSAVAPGFGGDVTVSVTVVNGYITEVTIDGPGETPTVGGAAIARAPGIMIRNNSADIEALSGATITTRAISTAGQAAIDKILAGQ